MSYTDRELKETILTAILDKKGEEVMDFDLSAFDSVVCQNFIICHGNSTTQVSAIAENVVSEVKDRLGLSAWSKSGTDNNFWIIIDFGSINVHVFLRDHRDFYRLEELWADAQIQKITEAEFE